MEHMDNDEFEGDLISPVSAAPLDGLHGRWPMAHEACAIFEIDALSCFCCTDRMLRLECLLWYISVSILFSCCAWVDASRSMLRSRPHE